MRACVCARAHTHVRTRTASTASTPRGSKEARHLSPGRRAGATAVLCPCPPERTRAAPILAPLQARTVCATGLASCVYPWHRCWHLHTCFHTPAHAIKQPGSCGTYQLQLRAKGSPPPPPPPASVSPRPTAVSPTGLVDERGLAEARGSAMRPR